MYGLFTQKSSKCPVDFYFKLSTLLAKFITVKVWYIPPTRARESLGLPSPRDFPRAKPEGNPEGKANPGSPELLLEVYHSL